MIEKLLFGKTGHQSTRTIFGAAALSQVSESEKSEALEVLFEYGINHIDTAASYGDAELQLEPWLRPHRDKFFLATKTEQRTYQGAIDELHQSLERMNVDHIDLWQMHFLIDPGQWEIAMGSRGALEAFIEAKEKGLVRFLGVTGHDYIAPSIHLRSLERFEFDSVLLVYNYLMMQNPTYANDFQSLYDYCQKHNIAMQTIKSITLGPWGKKIQNYKTWYEPLVKQGDIDLAIHWAMGKKGVFLNTAGDLRLLPKVLDAASRFERAPSDDAMKELVARNQMSSLFD
jgi:aryl-alcohol dehydrogenase-like predicted oxidoreductase